MKKKADAWTTAKIQEELRWKYPEDAWALLFEVADGTGMDKRRTADALVMSLWPSRGLELHGIEIKASRTDWVKELRMPAKAEAIARFCDRWWLVVGDKDIVHTGELPPTWGLMAPKRTRLGVVVEAPKLEPVPITRPFMASLFRAAQRYADSTKHTEDEIQKRVKERVDADLKAKHRRLHMAADELKKLRKRVYDFETASGVNVGVMWHGSDPKKTGRALRMLMDGDREVEHFKERLRSLGVQAKRMTEHLDESLASMDFESILKGEVE